jgi:hypothetical protein
VTHGAALATRTAILAATLAIAATAHAAMSVHTTVSAHQAEVGEGVRIELSAMSDDDTTPNTPRLKVPPGFSVQGPSVSSSQQLSFSNGHFEHRRGITASWIVIGTQPGRFVIGPPTVSVDQQIVQGEAATIDVVPAGSIPKPKRPRSLFDPTDPFDPFSLLQRMPNLQGLDDLDDALANAQPQIPDEYVVQHAPEDTAFLRATVTPSHAVVGQQVTLRVYAYGGRGPYDEAASSEPSRADFLSNVLVESSYRQPRYSMSIDQGRWSVVKLREVALFPLRAGGLTVGPMSMGFRGPGYPETQPMHGLERSSPPITVNVKEPPLAGRPAGYELGDVGHYTLSAEVEPRRVNAGEAVAIVIRLEGRGNVPNHVKLPDQKGVDWLDPVITDAVVPRESIVGGWRQFRYVVKLDEPGSVDLGEVTLPYYDADSGRYETARVKLGTVEVAPPLGGAAAARPAGSATAEATAPRDPFEGLGGARKKLGPVPASPRYWADQSTFWGLLGGAPVGVVGLGALTWLVRRWRERRGTRTESFAAVARRAIADAAGAAKRGDVGAVAAGVEKAVYTTIEGKLGLKARAVLRERLAPELARNGADEPLAHDVTQVLDACDSLRFAATDAPASKALVARAVAVVSRLGKVSRVAPREQAS